MSSPPLESPSRERLEQLYVDDRMSSKDIARMFNVAVTTVHNWRSRLGIQAKPANKGRKQSQEHIQRKADSKRRPIPATKFCHRCGLVKPESEWGRRTVKRARVAPWTGLKGHCKSCEAERSRLHHRADPARSAKSFRRFALRTKYGITPEEYDRMLQEQGGACRICKQPKSATSRTLAVDHDHDSGHTRGLLCDRCNLLLPIVENTQLLGAAIDYLEFYRQKQLKQAAVA